MFSDELESDTANLSNRLKAERASSIVFSQSNLFGNGLKCQR